MEALSDAWRFILFASALAVGSLFFVFDSRRMRNIRERRESRAHLLMLYSWAQGREDDELVRRVRLEAAIAGYDLEAFGVRRERPAKNTPPLAIKVIK